jgi:isopentenyldiphosphate isomerase
MKNVTTDNQQELFDVVNEQDEVVGQATRGECHSNPKLIHRSIGVYVINKQNQVFLQQRSKTKDKAAGKWSFSASGHVTSGDEYLETACKELKEELGVVVEASQLISLGKHLN